MRPTGTAEELEARRRRGVELLDTGKTPTQVSEILGVARQTVQRWKKVVRDGGKRALKAVPQHVPSCRLSPEQHGELEKIITAGAMASGYPTELWTTGRVTASVANLSVTGGSLMLCHVPQPFYRKRRRSWHVELGGKQINLGKDRTEAFKRYYESPPTRSKNALQRRLQEAACYLPTSLISFLTGCNCTDQRQVTVGASTDSSGSSIASLRYLRAARRVIELRLLITSRSAAAALRDFDWGDRGQPASQFVAEFKKKSGLAR